MTMEVRREIGDPDLVAAKIARSIPVHRRHLLQPHQWVAQASCLLRVLSMPSERKGSTIAPP